MHGTLEGNSSEITGYGYAWIAVQSHRNLTKLDSDLQSVNEQVISANDQLNDVLDTLRRYQETLEFNPRRLEQIEDRLMLLNGLKRNMAADSGEYLNLLPERGKTCRLENSEEEILALEDESRTEVGYVLDCLQAFEERVASAKNDQRKCGKGTG